MGFMFSDESVSISKVMESFCFIKDMTYSTKDRKVRSVSFFVLETPFSGLDITQSNLTLHSSFISIAFVICITCLDNKINFL